LGVYLFFASSATKLHFFLGVFFHFIIGADTAEFRLFQDYRPVGLETKMGCGARSFRDCSLDKAMAEWTGYVCLYGKTDRNIFCGHIKEAK
jgi:hypothetical protein